jgi:hypothetical protein
MEGKEALLAVFFVKFVMLKLCACAVARENIKAAHDIVAVVAIRRNPLNQFDISPP